jgi:hypothetical protein
MVTDRPTYTITLRPEPGVDGNETIRPKTGRSPNLRQ